MIRKSAADLIVIGAAALIISLSKLTVIRKQSLQLSRADIVVFVLQLSFGGRNKNIVVLVLISELLNTLWMHQI